MRPCIKETVKSYLKQKAPNLIFSDTGFNRFYKCTSGIPAYVNIFATLLPKDIKLDEHMVKIEFEDKIKVINSHLVVMWDKLTLREQYIIISLLDMPLSLTVLNVESSFLMSLQRERPKASSNWAQYKYEPSREKAMPRGTAATGIFLTSKKIFHIFSNS